MAAAKMTFILKDSQSLTDTLIYCVIRIGDLRMKYSTNEKIHPDLWDKDSHRVIVSGPKDQKERATVINLQLNRYDKTFVRIDTERIKLDLQPALEYYRAEFDKEFKKLPAKTDKPTDLMTFIDEWIKSIDRKKGSKTAYRTTEKALKGYETDSKKKLNFDKITLEFKDRFVKYLKDNKAAINTIHKHVKNIKVFMEHAYNRNLHNNLLYKNKLFQVETEDTFSITLSETELEILFTKKIVEPKLDRIRDIFILACRTGLRFSDLRQLTSDNIISNGTQIRLTTIKTGEQVIIPLHYQVQEILKKHDGLMPRVPSNQKFNKYLKELGQLIELNDTVVISRTIGNFKKDSIYQKWELITAHTARRTFATLAYLAKIPVYSIMKLTGHRTEKAFYTYIKISQQQNADLIQNHEFFTGKKQTQIKIVRKRTTKKQA